MNLSPLLTSHRFYTKQVKVSMETALDEGTNIIMVLDNQTNIKEQHAAS